MLNSLRDFFRKLFGLNANRTPADLGNVRILKHAQAMRVIFFYPGEEGTYVDQATVTLFENGIVHIRAKNEETTTHLSHCEILWRYDLPENESQSKKGKGGKDEKLRVLKFKPRGEQGPTPPPGPTI